jgi:peroxiredoxin
VTAGARTAVWLVFAAGATLTVADCAHAPAPPPPSTPSPLLGAEVPAFHRPTLDGATFDTAGAAGHVLIVDFFADYCRPCQRALPALEALHREHPELAVVGVSLDEDPARALRSVTRHHLSFPVVHDAGSVLAGRFRVTELPYSFVVDGTGKVRFVCGFEQPDDALARVVAALTRGS